MAIHIGQVIKKISKSKGVGPTELSRRIKKSRTNVNDIFTREAIDTDLLVTISKAVEYDFFALYSEQLRKAGLRSLEAEVEELRTSLESNHTSIILQQQYIAALEEKLHRLQGPAGKVRKAR